MIMGACPIAGRLLFIRQVSSGQDSQWICIMIMMFIVSFEGMEQSSKKQLKQKRGIFYGWGKEKEREFKCCKV